MLEIISGINWLDIVFLTILLGMIYRGSHAGVGSQLLSLAWWFVLIFFSIGYYSLIASKLFGFMVQGWARAVSFFIIVAVLWAIIKFLQRVFNIERAENLSPVERIGGSVVSSLRAFLFFGMVGIQFLILPVNVLHNSVSEGSKTGMFFVDVNADIYSWMTSHLAFVEEKTREEVVEGFFASRKNN